MKSTIAIGAVVVAGVMGYLFWPASPKTTDTTAGIGGEALVDVILPDTLSSAAQIGKIGFEAKCAACHGVNAAGKAGVAPPLVHIIYEPGHHGDESFQRAAAMGVRAHHWRFGDMPAIDDVTPADVTMITAYIRELQVANGIN